MVNHQTDAIRSLCNTFSINIPRLSGISPRSSPKPRTDAPTKSFNDMMDDIRLDISGFLDSVLAAGGTELSAPASKRNRTSSTSPNTTDPEDKRRRVNVSMDDPATSITTPLLPLSDPPNSIDAAVVATDFASLQTTPSYCETGDMSVESTEIVGDMLTSALQPSIASRQAPATSASTTTAMTTTANTTSVASSIITNATIATAATTTTTTAATLNANIATSTIIRYVTATTASTPNEIDATVNSAATVSTSSATPSLANASSTAVRSFFNAARRQLPSTVATHRRFAAHPASSSTASAIVTDPPAYGRRDLAVVPPEDPVNWYYLTKFLPHETEQNIIQFIVGKVRCDPITIRCFKLISQSRPDERPPTFVSFKICVPRDVEVAVTSNSFWPALSHASSTRTSSIRIAF